MHALQVLLCSSADEQTSAKLPFRTPEAVVVQPGWYDTAALRMLNHALQQILLQM